jgi:hypothetical protein
MNRPHFDEETMAMQIAHFAPLSAPAMTGAPALDLHEDIMASHPIGLSVTGTIAAILFALLFAAIVVHDLTTGQVGSPF